MAREYEILSRIIKEASAYIANVLREDYLLWMEYVQHFGVPTRLLDFSSNPLVALYFCCKNKPEIDGSEGGRRKYYKICEKGKETYIQKYKDWEYAKRIFLTSIYFYRTLCYIY